MLIRYPDDEGKNFTGFDYPAGEQQVRLTDEAVTQIKLADKIQVIARLQSSADVIKLLLLSNALMHHAKRRETELILPYFPYARADRRFTLGDCIGVDVFRTLVDTMGYDKVVTLDIHSAVTKNLITTLFDNRDAQGFIDNILESHLRTRVLLPDAGSVSRYWDFSDSPKCEKKRDPATGKLSGFVVPDKEVFKDDLAILLVDDICDGGGTFIGIARELRAKGIEQPLYLYVTHGIFSQGFDRLGLHFEQIFTTNSFNFTYPAFEPLTKLTVFDCEPLLLGE